MNRFDTSRYVRPTKRLLNVGLIACLASSGCASFEGLRSIAAYRPSLLGFRDRAQPSTPAPGDDLYARTMNGGAKASAPPDAQAGASAVVPQPAQEPSVTPADHDGGTVSSNTATAKVVATKGAGDAKADSRPLDSGHEPVALGSPQPLVSATPAKPLQSRSASADELLHRAEDRITSLSTYQVKLERTERTRGRLQPVENIVMSIRRNPKAVRFSWEDGPSKGRELIYSNAIDPKMLFVHMSNTPFPLPTMKIAVDSPMVTSNSRHSITDAGLDRIIQNLRKAERDDLTYKGLETPPGAVSPCHCFTHRTASMETWTVYLDTTSLMPTFVIANDAKGELVERYRYEEVRENPPELATASAFDPDARWGSSKGLFSRLSGAAADAASRRASESVAK